MADEKTDILELIDELDRNIAEIKRRSAEEGVDNSATIASLESDRDRVIRAFFSNLSAWDEVRLARHPRRPYTLDYLHAAFDDYTELHGDRLFGDDGAMIAAMGWIGGYPVFVCGQQKGRDIKERRLRNFGSARPEGYRKALRMMHLAEKWRRPVVTIIDTPAADCGVEAEERGISESLARNLMEMFRIRTPIVVTLIGEGGSGGALGIGVGDRILMLEHGIYSVIPPEGCAAILWREPERKVDAAQALRLTSHDALDLGLIDQIVPEPFGGAHRDPEAAALSLRQAILGALKELTTQDLDALLERRYAKFRKMGFWVAPEAEEGEGAAAKPASARNRTRKKKQEEPGA